MGEEAYKAFRCAVSDGFAVIEWAKRPSRAWQLPEFLAELERLCEEIAWAESIRVAVMSFDGSLEDAWFEEIEEATSIPRIPLSAPLAFLKQPVIAAIRGDAFGPWLELALACDIRVGAENARYGLPQIRYGVLPSDGGTQRLPRLIGRGKAMEMILTCNPVEAEEAHRIGLIHRMVPAPQVEATALSLAREMSEKSPIALGYAKEAVLKSLDLTLDQGIQMELDLYLLLFSTKDRVEGIRAFQERRKPRFEGV